MTVATLPYPSLGLDPDPSCAKPGSRDVMRTRNESGIGAETGVRAALASRRRRMVWYGKRSNANYKKTRRDV